MLNPTICAQCFMPNQAGLPHCWRCRRSMMEPPTREDFARFFGLQPGWRKQDVKAGYLRLARKYHPDTNSHDQEAEAFFKFVNQAYEALSRIGSDPTQFATVASKPRAHSRVKMGLENWEAYLKALSDGSLAQPPKPAAPLTRLQKLQKFTRWLVRPEKSRA